MDISRLQPEEDTNNQGIDARGRALSGRGRRHLARRAGVAALALVGAVALPGALAGAATVSPHVEPATGLVHESSSGLSLAPGLAGHTLTMPGPSKGPDDISGFIGSNLFVGYQNGVGPNGEPSPSGGTNSTIIEYRQDGTVVAQ
ncbi:MAG: hypothetical protein IVW52_12060 [Acidimicrobiales bacterium]|nr:hypothetical protein [Acidimicrobiales bacterium]